MTAPNWRKRAKDADLCIRNFINGDYTQINSESANEQGRPTINKMSPGDGSLLYTFGAGTATDTDEAVASAKAAFDDGRWKNLSVYVRKGVLQKLADLIEANQEELALYECLDVGKPVINALQEDIPVAAAIIRSCAEKADKLLSPSATDGGHFACQLRKPVGVVGGIIGWNYPLMLAAGRVGPALAMGNSIVLKPSEFSSLSAGRLAELATEAGVPPGVFNVVHGEGSTVGVALAQHSDVNLLSFVGSSATGKQMMIAAGHSNMKRLILECGGKSPYLVFDDCPQDLDAVAENVVAKAFPNQGALCVAGTRLLIQESIKDQLIPKILAKTAEIIPKDPLDLESRFGALVNEAHMEKVLAYIESGEQEGAELIYGGHRVLRETGGYFVEPTIFDKVNPQQKIAQEEIFGPVLSVLTFKDENEAIKLANDTCFGLAAYAATENLGRAQRLGQRLDAGRLRILGSSSPSGGSVDMSADKHHESGFGYSGGLEGLVAYTTSTTVHIQT